MRLRLLGTAAGGGFPQWNCRCSVCQAARSGRALPRTQAGAALSGDGRAWFLPSVLALGMAFCNGWNFPDAVSHLESRHAAYLDLLQAARHGSRPLTELVVRFCDNFAYASEKLLLTHLLRLRNAHLSIYKKTAWDRYPIEAVWARRWQAETSNAEGGLRTVADVWASGGGVVEPSPGSALSGSVQYEVEVPAEGLYVLFARALVPA